MKKREMADGNSRERRSKFESTENFKGSYSRESVNLCIPLRKDINKGRLKSGLIDFNKT